MLSPGGTYGGGSDHPQTSTYRTNSFYLFPVNEVNDTKRGAKHREGVNEVNDWFRNPKCDD